VTIPGRLGLEKEKEKEKAETWQSWASSPADPICVFAKSVFDKIHPYILSFYFHPLVF